MFRCLHGSLVLAPLTVLLLALAGCSRNEQISRYVEPDAGAATSAQAPHSGDSMKPPAGGQGSPVRFVGTVPKNWQEGPVSGMRKAAFTVEDGDQKVGITAVDLPLFAGQLLPNVNRWRAQLKLEETSPEAMKESLQPIEVAGAQGSYIELLGPEEQEPRQAILGVIVQCDEVIWVFKLAGSADLALREKGSFQDYVRSLKFERVSGSAVVPPPRAGNMPPVETNPATLHYEQPEGWVPGRVGGMRKAAFTLQDGAQQAEVTVIDLTTAAGNWLDNINRWRQQLKLDAITESQLEDRPIQVGDVEGRYVEMADAPDADPRTAIVGVMALRENRVWFYKLMGHAELVEREKGRFEAFVQSVSFEAAKQDQAATGDDATPHEEDKNDK